GGDCDDCGGAEYTVTGKGAAGAGDDDPVGMVTPNWIRFRWLWVCGFDVAFAVPSPVLGCARHLLAAVHTLAILLSAGVAAGVPTSRILAAVIVVRSRAYRHDVDRTVSAHLLFGVAT